MIRSRSSRRLVLEAEREHARQQHALGIDQVGDPRGEHARLARAGPAAGAPCRSSPAPRTAAAGSSRAAGRAARAQRHARVGRRTAAGAAPRKAAAGARRAAALLLLPLGRRWRAALGSSRRWSRVFCAWHGAQRLQVGEPVAAAGASGTMWSTSSAATSSRTPRTSAPVPHRLLRRLARQVAPLGLGDQRDVAASRRAPPPPSSGGASGAAARSVRRRAARSRVGRGRERERRVGRSGPVRGGRIAVAQSATAELLC